MGGGKKDRKMVLKKLARIVGKDKFRELLSNHVELVNAMLSKKRGRVGTRQLQQMHRDGEGPHKPTSPPVHQSLCLYAVFSASGGAP